MHKGRDLYLIVDTQSHSWFYSTWKLSKQYVCVLECFSSLECLPGTFEMFNFLTANLFNIHFPTQLVAIIVQCIVLWLVISLKVRMSNQFFFFILLNIKMYMYVYMYMHVHIMQPTVYTPG